MMENASLESALKSLALHDHCCLISESRQEQLAAVIPFLSQGIERGEKCVYIRDQSPAEAILGALSHAAVDVEAARRKGALVLAHSRDTYLEGDFFDPDRMMEVLETEADSASAAGFPALRVAGEMTWARGGAPGAERLLEYESRLASLHDEKPVVTICQYDRRHFPADDLLGVIHTHPFVIHRGRLWQNFYHVPAADFLGPDQPERELDRLLNNIRRRGHVEAALRRAQDELEARVRERTEQLERANQALRAEMAERSRALAAYQASEQRYRHLFEEADDIICTFDLQGKFTSLNRAGEHISGYRREELLGRSMAVLTEPDGTERGFRMLQAKLGGQASTAYELPIRTREGHKMLLEVRSRLLFDGGKPAGILAIGRDVTERTRTEEVLRESEAALQRSREQLRALAAGLLTAQEEERRRLSRELHDDLNQKLAMLAVQAESLEQELPPTYGAIRDRIAKLREGANSLSDDVRHIAYQLHPSILDHLGLVVALRSLCHQFSCRHGVKTRFFRRGLPATIPQDAALCLYRVAQEALGNVAKHSRSLRSTVALSGGPGGLHLSVTDYGVGFDPGAFENRRGLGLISMEERVRLADGTFSVRSHPRGGTRLDVRIPLPVSLYETPPLAAGR